MSDAKRQADNPAGRAILYVCNDLSYFRLHRAHVARAMAARGQTVTVIADAAGQGTQGLEGMRFLPARILRHGLGAGDLRLMLTVLRALAGARPDCVHCITLKANVLGGLAARLAGLLGFGPRRIVLTVPGLGRAYAEEDARFRARLRRWLINLALRWICATPKVRASFETAADRDVWLAHGLIAPERAIVVNGTGVDLEQFAPGDDTARDPRAVLFAGRLLRSKGLDVFLDAARLLAETAPDLRFLIAGRPERDDPDGFDPNAEDLPPNVEVLGFVEAMPALLRRVGLVCLPSRYGEGVPRILLEAAACGTPTLAADLPGCRVAIRDGETGRLMPASGGKDVAAHLAGLIRSMTEDPDAQAEMGRAARAHILGGAFSTEDIQEAFRTIYDAA